MELNITITQESELVDVAKKIHETFPTDRIFTLFGSMGAGKTTFVKAMGEVLNVIDVVNSPTFALVNQYNIADGGAVYHFDLYRINKIEELYDIGYEEYLYSGNYCFLEWPEKMAELLPESYVYIKIEELDDGSRNFEVKKIH